MTNKLTAIPLPTTPIPNPTMARVTRLGLGWRPRKASTKQANVELFHRGQYNQVHAGRSILLQMQRKG